jgi:hypothetical protein
MNKKVNKTIKRGKGKLAKNFWALPRLDDPTRLVFKALLDEREVKRQRKTKGATV